MTAALAIITPILALTFAYFAPKHFSEKELTVKYKLRTLLYSVIALLAASGFMSIYSDKATWTTYNILSLSRIISLCAGCILFIVAMVIESQNTNDKYKLQFRQIKYGFQSLSFFFFAMFITTIPVGIVAAHDIVRETTLGFLLPLASAWLTMEAAKQLVQSVQFFVSARIIDEKDFTLSERKKIKRSPKR